MGTAFISFYLESPARWTACTLASTGGFCTTMLDPARIRKCNSAFQIWYKWRSGWLGSRSVAAWSLRGFGYRATIVWSCVSIPFLLNNLSEQTEGRAKNRASAKWQMSKKVPTLSSDDSKTSLMQQAASRLNFKTFGWVRRPKPWKVFHFFVMQR